MSVRPVRTALPHEPAPRLGRLYARVAPQTPLLPRALLRVVNGLSPASRLRRTALGQIAFTNYDAWCREDAELALLAYHPRAELHVPPELTTLGFDSAYVGHDGLKAFMRRWAETWSELSITPTALLDHGPELVVLAVMRARGRDSSVQTTTDLPQLIRFAPADGRVIEQRVFMSTETATAAGVDLS